MSDKFQIKKAREFLQIEESMTWRAIEEHRLAAGSLGERITWIQKCREEINQANKILREK